MVTIDDLNLQQDVITLRLSYLSRSSDFRDYVMSCLNADEDPFGIDKFDTGDSEIGIVGDERDDFAAKLDSLLGTGAAAEYLEAEEQLAGSNVNDTAQNREHIWEYWQSQANGNVELRPKKKLLDLDALSQGTWVQFIGEYTLPEGSTPDIELSDDGQGHPRMMFRNTPSVWGKLVG